MRPTAQTAAQNRAYEPGKLETGLNRQARRPSIPNDPNPAAPDESKRAAQRLDEFDSGLSHRPQSAAAEAEVAERRTEQITCVSNSSSIQELETIRHIDETGKFELIINHKLYSPLGIKTGYAQLAPPAT